MLYTQKIQIQSEWVSPELYLCNNISYWSTFSWQFDKQFLIWTYNGNIIVDQLDWSVVGCDQNRCTYRSLTRGRNSSCSGFRGGTGRRLGWDSFQFDMVFHLICTFCFVCGNSREWNAYRIYLRWILSLNEMFEEILSNATLAKFCLF